MATKDLPIALSLLGLAHPPSIAEKIHLERVVQRPLHLKPTEPTYATAQIQRREKRQSKLAAIKKKHKPAPLSSRQKRSLDLYTIPPSVQKYAIYEPLHRMWIGYMQEILWDGKGFRPIDQGMLSKICSADFHGAEIEVVRSGCVSRVGVKGIVVKDLRGVFEVVTKMDKVKSLPKEGTLFRFAVKIPKEEGKDGEEPETANEKAKGESMDVDGTEEKIEKKVEEVVFELHGNQFQFRAADRATKKFKLHFLPDL